MERQPPACLPPATHTHARTHVHLHLHLLASSQAQAQSGARLGCRTSSERLAVSCRCPSLPTASQSCPLPQVAQRHVAAVRGSAGVEKKRAPTPTFSVLGIFIGTAVVRPRCHQVPGEQFTSALQCSGKQPRLRTIKRCMSLVSPRREDCF